MSYLSHLKRTNNCQSCRWIVKRDSKTDLIREVKLVYNPEEYSKENIKRYGKKARKLHTQDEVIVVLKQDKEKRNA